MSMTVIGLDLSLACSGLAIFDDCGDVYTHRVKTAGHKGATTEFTAKRVASAVDQIVRFAFSQPCNHPVLAVIESPSFGSKGGAAHERGGVWWGVASALAERDVPIATAAPTTRAVYATGDGRADKKAVTAAVRQRYFNGEGFLCPDNNVADAVVLAAMGRRWLGFPVDDLDDTFTRSVRSAKWPTIA